MAGAGSGPMIPGWSPGAGRRGMPRVWERDFRVYSVATKGRDDLERGDKILLPPSALQQMGSMDVQYPLKFRLQQEGVPLIAHCGVKEFMAEEGRAYVPYWLMQAVGVAEGGYLRITNVALPQATYFKIRPRKKLFIQLENPKNVLEVALREYTCVTKGVAIRIPYSGRQFDIDVLDVKPENPTGAASIVEADVEIDFATPLDMVEEEAAKQAKRAAEAETSSASSSASSSSSSSSSGAAEPDAPLIMSSPEGAKAAAMLRKIRAERRARAKLRAASEEDEGAAIITSASGRVGDGPSVAPPAAASSSSSSSSSSLSAHAADSEGRGIAQRKGSVSSRRSGSRGRAGSASRGRASSRNAADEQQVPDRGAMLMSGTEGRRLRDSKRKAADPDVAHLLSTTDTPGDAGATDVSGGAADGEDAGFIGTGRSMGGRQADGEAASSSSSSSSSAKGQAAAESASSAGSAASDGGEPDSSAPSTTSAFAGVAYRPSGKAPLRVPRPDEPNAKRPTAAKITAALGAAGGTCLAVGELPPGEW